MCSCNAEMIKSKSIENSSLPEHIIVDSDDNATNEIFNSKVSNVKPEKNCLNLTYTHLVHDRIRILEQTEKVLRRRISALPNSHVNPKRQRPIRCSEYLLGERQKNVVFAIANRGVTPTVVVDDNDSKTEQMMYAPSLPSPKQTDKKADLNNVRRNLKRIYVKKKLLTAELRGEQIRACCQDQNDPLENMRNQFLQKASHEHWTMKRRFQDTTAEEMSNSVEDNGQFQMKNTVKALTTFTSKPLEGAITAEGDRSIFTPLIAPSLLESKADRVEADTARNNQYPRVVDRAAKFSSGCRKRPTSKRSHAHAYIRVDSDVVVTIRADNKKKDLITEREMNENSAFNAERENVPPATIFDNARNVVSTSAATKSRTNNEHGCWSAYVDESAVDDIGYYVAKLLLMSPKSIENLNGLARNPVSFATQSQCQHQDDEGDDIGRCSSERDGVGDNQRLARSNKPSFKTPNDDAVTRSKVVCSRGALTQIVRRKNTSTGWQMSPKKSGEVDIEANTKGKLASTRPALLQYLPTAFNRDSSFSLSSSPSVSSSSSDSCSSSPLLTSSSFSNVTFDRGIDIDHDSANAAVFDFPILSSNEYRRLRPSRPFWKGTLNHQQPSAFSVSKRERKPLFSHKELAYYADSFEDQRDMSTAGSLVSVSESKSSVLAASDEVKANYHFTVCSKKKETNGNDSPNNVTRRVDTVTNLSTPTSETITRTAVYGGDSLSWLVTAYPDKHAPKLGASPTCIVPGHSEAKYHLVNSTSIDELLARDIIDAALEKKISAIANSATARCSKLSESGDRNETVEEEEFIQQMLRVNFPEDRRLENACTDTDVDHIKSFMAEDATATNTAISCYTVPAQALTLTSGIGSFKGEQNSNEVTSSPDDVKRRSRLLRWMGLTMQRTLEAAIVHSTSSPDESGDSLRHIARTSNEPVVTNAEIVAPNEDYFPNGQNLSSSANVLSYSPIQFRDVHLSIPGIFKKSDTATLTSE